MHTFAALHIVPQFLPPAWSADAGRDMASTLRDGLWNGPVEQVTEHPDQWPAMAGATLLCTAAPAKPGWLPMVASHLRVVGRLAREAEGCGVTIPSCRLVSFGSLDQPLPRSDGRSISRESALRNVPIALPVPEGAGDGCLSGQCLPGPHAHRDPALSRNYPYYLTPPVRSQVYVATQKPLPAAGVNALREFLRDALDAVARAHPGVPVLALGRVNQTALAELSARAAAKANLAEHFRPLFQPGHV